METQGAGGWAGGRLGPTLAAAAHAAESQMGAHVRAGGRSQNNVEPAGRQALLEKGAGGGREQSAEKRNPGQIGRTPQRAL